MNHEQGTYYNVEMWKCEATPYVRIQVELKTKQEHIIMWKCAAHVKRDKFALCENVSRVELRTRNFRA